MKSTRVFPGRYGLLDWTLLSVSEICFKSEAEKVWILKKVLDNITNKGELIRPNKFKESRIILANSFLSSTSESPITLAGMGISVTPFILILLSKSKTRLVNIKLWSE